MAKQGEHTSPLYSVSNEYFRDVVQRSTAFQDVLRFFNMKTAGGNYDTLRKRITELEINIDHFHRVYGFALPTTQVSDVMVENYTGSPQQARRVIVRTKVLGDICHKCGTERFWNGKPLTLQIHHVNGNPKDNRKENLQLLCPNCHSQTYNYGSKNIHKPTRYCIQCQQPLHGHQKRFCSNQCNGKYYGVHRRKVVRPTKEQLETDSSLMTMAAIGRKYGVCDNAVRKWIKQYNS